MFTLELHTITSPTHPLFLTKLLNPALRLLNHPPYLPHQAISLSRTLILTFFIALSQIGPLLFGPTVSGKDISPQQLSHLGLVVGETDREVKRLLELELVPFRGDEGMEGELRAGLRRWLVDNAVRGRQEVRDAVGRVVERRRQGVPAGATGAR